MPQLRARATCAVVITPLIRPARVLVPVQNQRIYYWRRTYTVGFPQTVTQSPCLLAFDTILGGQRQATGLYRRGRFSTKSSIQNTQITTDETAAHNTARDNLRPTKTVDEPERSDLRLVGTVVREAHKIPNPTNEDGRTDSKTKSESRSHNAFSADRSPVYIESLAESAAFDRQDPISVFESTLQHHPEDFAAMQWDDSYLLKSIVPGDGQSSVDAFVRRYDGHKAKTQALEDVVDEATLFPAEEMRIRAQLVDESPPATWINLPDSKEEELVRQVLGKRHVRVRAFVSEATIAALRRDKNKLLKELGQQCDVQIQLRGSFVPFDKRDRFVQVVGIVENVAKTFASLSRNIQNVSLSSEDRQLRLLLIVPYRVAGGISRDPQTVVTIQELSSSTIAVSHNLLYRSTDRILTITAHNSRSLYVAMWEICKFIAPPDWIREVSAVLKTPYKSYVGVRPKSERLTHTKQRQSNLDRSNPIKLEDESARLKTVKVRIPKMHIGFVMGTHDRFRLLVREKTGAYVTVHRHRPTRVGQEANAITSETDNIENEKGPSHGSSSDDFVCVIRSSEWSRANRAAFLYRNRIQLAEARYRRIKHDQLI
ncbi:hypothetical protein V1525DRAFT_456826 [Lipomyces kononenkoae]|uniref:Uncharacterized protein n=1 Tax=Lipomyces kononenkoae TaxID=34357 RepID=A0ACC3T0E9_LIPKO